MIGRIFDPTGSFQQKCWYVSQNQERARVLYQEGVRGHDYRLMARDFEMVHGMRETISKPVFHAVLLFHREERLEDARLVEIARRYLDEVGMTNTQYAIVRHLDTEHTHLHLLSNRIDYNGEPIHNFPEILRNRDAVEKLVREYELIPVAAKNLRQTNFDALDASDTRKYAVYRGIRECLPDCRDMEELGQRLLQLGIETRYRTDPETGQRTGISFLYQHEAFRGSEIDRECSLPRLEKKLGQRQELSQWESEKLVLRDVQREREELALKERQVLEERQALSAAQRQKRGLEEEEGPREVVRRGPRLSID
ncbi:MAG TPA: relaxase/mobilization nuclease domain-containing protein [Puia sp.]|jgi:hypothetical protein|nr:relaxase/mobilization nuclease domain-containing protein [Puia sp.]